MELGDVAAIKHYLARLVETPPLKIGAAVAAWLVNALYGPSYESILAMVATLWAWDWATGMTVALLSPGVRVKSRRWYHAIVKLLVYLVVLSMARQFSRARIAVVGIALSSAAEGLIMATEGKSILENLRRLCQIAGVSIPWLAALSRGIDRIEETISARLRGERSGKQSDQA